MSNFIHLHTHSEYSLLDGAARIEDLVRQAKEFEMPALALTDHGAMYGIIDFYEIARKYGIKPIIGCEVYLAPRGRFEKSSKKEDSPHHLVLLAKNEQGYQNLMRLVTLGFLDGYYYKPRVDKELLQKYHQGLIALSACLKGEIIKLIHGNDLEAAKRTALEYRDIFGKNNFYLEIQDQGIEEQKAINKTLAQISEDLKIPLVATNDIHYTNKEDSTAHDVLLCIQTGSTLGAEDRLKFSTQEFYFKSAQQMAEIFPEYPEALGNSHKIAERCQVKVDFDKIYLPHYEPPQSYNLDSYLEKLSSEGLKNRYSQISPEIEERLRHELSVIKEMGFSGYFLVVWDFVKYAKDQGIRVGPGRGSAAGSLVAYALGITNVDPLEYDLLFERFLNPERRTMPDIDIDFDDERRDEIIEYVAKKYGQDRVAQIITFGTMKARAATRDAGRVLGFPYAQVDKIAKLISEAPGATIEESLDTIPQLRQEYENSDETRRILDAAKALEGIARQDSIHAAGVVISLDELSKYTPLQKKGDGETVTQYHMDAVKKIGLLKMDFLGLRTLTVIDNALKIIKRTRNDNIDIDNIVLDNKKTYAMLCRGDSIGVFQLESMGMRSLLKDLKPTDFEDIINLLALYRPGPLGSNMVKDFVDRKHGRKAITYLHSALEPILNHTYGIIVYQEQVMQIASRLAGFTMAEADILRGAMSKKKPEVLAQQRDKFVSGAISNDIDAETAGKIFDLMAFFAGYGFNRSHSTAYAMISYQTAYLKANYPEEFMAALLTSVMGNKDKIPQYVNECRRLGIEILPPDINESLSGFTVVGKARLPEPGTPPASASHRRAGGGQAIRFGLSAVRNVGDNIIEAIIEARKDRPFTSIYDFCQRIDLSVVNKRALESLIKCGTFDSLGATRKNLLNIYEKAIEVGTRRQKDTQVGQFSFFDSAEKENHFYEPDESEQKEEFPREKLLAYEKEILGLYVSDHPLWGMEAKLRSKSDVTIGQLKEQKDGSSLRIAGIISKISRVTTKKGDLMLFVTVEDLEGLVEVIVFPAVYQQYQSLIVEDKVVCVKGRLDIKEENVKLIAQEIESIEAGKKEPAPVYVRVPAKTFNKQLMARIKDIFKNHHGSVPVYLQLAQDDKITTFRLNQAYWVNRNGGFFAELKELLGEDAVL